MQPAMNQPIGLTRRSLLCTGATAGVAVAVGLRPPGAAALIGDTAPGHLTRSAYAGLEGTTFPVETGVRPVALRLDSVVGSEDAFALSFSGPLEAPLDSGIHTLRHPALGNIELFSSPVDDPKETRHYEVIVDRTLGARKAQSQAPAAPRAPHLPEAVAPPVEPEPVVALVRKVSLRRAGRWARCEVVLLRTVSAERVRCRLLHRGRLVASAARDVSDGRAVMRLEATRPLRPGTYVLVVTAADAEGTKTSERRRVTLR
jgi:hypothetical protein